ncbi:hypothetical protein [Xanthomonas euroxanthea]|uniref:hypothetical protein n=1 Tax=Xanthomonas euroxanthea TaxID=2259622 RepID=UPI0016122A5C|nr:hypothetical protein [Xanthomonas euroxanthea]MBB5767797.1 hypothetical protein [Xanthomonas euroxanthea]
MREALGNAAIQGDLGLPPDLQISGIAVLTNDLSTHPAKYAMRHPIPYTSIATQRTKLTPKLAVHVGGYARAAGLM